MTIKEVSEKYIYFALVYRIFTSDENCVGIGMFFFN